MGFGDNWKAAMDKVKDTYVPPGEQTELIRRLAREAEQFFEGKNWITIPELAKEDWRMEMISPDRQRVSPFFLGGATFECGKCLVVESADAEVGHDGMYDINLNLVNAITW